MPILRDEPPAQKGQECLWSCAALYNTVITLIFLLNKQGDWSFQTFYIFFPNKVECVQWGTFASCPDISHYPITMKPWYICSRLSYRQSLAPTHAWSDSFQPVTIWPDQAVASSSNHIFWMDPWVEAFYLVCQVVDTWPVCREILHADCDHVCDIKGQWEKGLLLTSWKGACGHPSKQSRTHFSQ